MFSYIYIYIQLYIFILFFFFLILVSFGSFLSFINPLLPTPFNMNGYLLTKEYYLKTTLISLPQYIITKHMYVIS